MESDGICVWNDECTTCWNFKAPLSAPRPVQLRKRQVSQSALPSPSSATTRTVSGAGTPTSSLPRTSATLLPPVLQSPTSTRTPPTTTTNFGAGVTSSSSSSSAGPSPSLAPCKLAAVNPSVQPDGTAIGSENGVPCVRENLTRQLQTMTHHSLFITQKSMSQKTARPASSSRLASISSPPLQ